LKLLVFAVALLAACALPAHGLVYCDSAGKSLDAEKEANALYGEMLSTRYADLDRDANAAIASFEAGKISDEELVYRFRVFACNCASNEALHDEWIRIFPRSRAAYLAAAQFWHARAFGARGYKFASETTDAQFAQMQSFFRREVKALKAARELAKTPTPEWAMRIEMDYVEGVPQDAHVLYRVMLKMYPRSIAVRTAYADAVRPKWGGSVVELDRVAADARTLPADDRRYVEAEVLHHIGDDFELRRLYKEAAERYQRAMELCPALTDSAEQAMRIYAVELKDCPKSIDAATRYIARRPMSSKGYRMRGWCRAELNQYEPALADYRKAADLGDPQALQAVAWFYEWGRGGAEQSYRKAIDLYMDAYRAGAPDAKAMADKIRAGTGLK
jgi:tetratricopeptide (TPR) repeat protein